MTGKQIGIRPASFGEILRSSCSLTGALEASGSVQQKEGSIMVLCVSPGLGVMNPLKAFVKPPAGSKEPFDLLETEAIELGIYEPNTEPANGTYGCVDRKCPARSEDLHHRQKGKANGEIGPPVCRRGKCRSKRSYVEREELRLLPRYITEPKCVGCRVYRKANKNDHREQGVIPSRVAAVWAFLEVGQVRQLQKRKRKSADAKRNCHDRDRIEEDAAPAYSINENECEHCENKVGHGH